ncbi:MAG: hypothetical protein L7U87_02230 [Chlamydiales bacterium]|nr:hypothetical protein [Chlamydiales bacterium]
MTKAKQDLIFFDEAKEKILNGIERIIDLTIYTYGPMGTNIKVVSENTTEYFSPRTANIVQDVELMNKFEKLGEHFTKALINKVDTQFQDGSCLAILLLYSLVKNGLKQIKEGHHSQKINEELKEATQFIIQHLKDNAFFIDSQKSLTLFINQVLPKNPEMALLLNEIFQDIGIDGDILIEPCINSDHFAQVSPGGRVDIGFASSYFCDSKDCNYASLDFPLVLLCDTHLSSAHKLLSLFQQIGKAKEQLILIAPSFDPNLLATLSLNYLQGSIKVCPVEAPKDPKKRQLIYEKLSKSCATHTFKELDTLENIANVQQLGRVKKAFIHKDFSHFLFDERSLALSFDEAEEIESLIQSETSVDKLNHLQQVLTFLTGNLGILYTNQHTDNAKQLSESISLISSVLKKGAVTGGGVALYRAGQALANSHLASKSGTQVLINACVSPLEKLIENSGADPLSILTEIQKAKKDVGYNAATKVVEDLRQRAIYDSEDLVTSVLELSVESAINILNIDAMIC